MGLFEHMKQLVLQLQAHPTFAKVWHWVKLIAITGGAQAIVQGASLISGIIVVRLLSIEEYALYTLANTVLGTMTVLADGGISTGVMAQGGKVWNDKEKLGLVLSTGLVLRRKFALVSLIISIPILAYLLFDHGAKWWMVLLILLALIPSFLSNLSDSLYQITLKLHQDVLPLQKNQINVSIGRLFLTGLLLFFTPYTFIAILANGLPRIYGNLHLKKANKKFIDNISHTDKAIENEILEIVKRILPGLIYYCISGQITIWLITFFGKTNSIAQIGALGRIIILYNLYSLVFSMLIVPRFARLNEHFNVLYRKYLQLQLFVIVVSVLSVLLINFFSLEILSILGKSYLGLDEELFLCLIGGCLNFMSSTSISLYTSRGFAIKPIISIPISIISTFFGVYFIDVTSILGVLKLNIFILLIQYLMHNTFSTYKMHLSKKRFFKDATK